MGLYINLVVNFDDIDDKKWEKTYEESVEMLQKFPIPLIRLEYEEINGSKRIVATEDIVQDKGLETEHWHICGDWESEQRAESFLLYRYQKARYNNRPNNNRPKPKANNILWAPKDSINYRYAWGADIFGDKTQGRPYHLAMLAVGILFENRFPGSIFVTGNINKEQAEGILPWMNSVLKEPIKLPIGTDGERLYKKLQELYDEPALAIQRFKTLYTEAGTASDILFKHAHRAHVLQSFVESLGHYTSITQLGAIRIIGSFLTATQDVKQLIEFVLQVGKDSNGFELEELLRVLVSRFITVEQEARKPLSLFVYPEKRLTTIEVVFAQTFLQLGGAPETIDFYIDSAELLKTFVSYMPSKEDVLQAIIQEEEQKCYQHIEKIKKMRRDSEEEPSPAQQGGEEQGEELSPAQQGSEEQGEAMLTYILEEAYIRSQTYMQKAAENEKKEELAKTCLRSLADATKKAIDNLPEVARDNSVQFYKKAIYEGSYKRRIVLSRSQWERIDNCQDKTILKSLMILANNPSNILVFVEFRDYILRNPQTWPQLAGTADSPV